MDNGIIRVGIAGYGLAGSVFHEPLIRAHRKMEIAGIFTSRDIPLRAASMTELIERSDLIVVASPNNTHFAIARQALEAGRHVVVDKPFTLTTAEADELIALASSRNLILSVFHNRRWDCDFLTVREWLPRLGDVMLFEANCDRFRPAIKTGWREVPETGSGLLSDLGPHLIDQALQLFGMPNFIEADIIAQRGEARVDDYFDLTLHYGRARVSLLSSTLVAAPRPRFSVHGSSGSFVKYGLDPQEAQLKSGLGPADEGFGIDLVQATLTDAHGRDEMVPCRPGNYFAYYEAIAEAVLAGAPVPVDPRDARDGLLVIDLARRASEQGRRLAVRDSSSKEG